jgi:hypothetical protein
MLDQLSGYQVLGLSAIIGYIAGFTFETVRDAIKNRRSR